MEQKVAETFKKKRSGRKPEFPEDPHMLILVQYFITQDDVKFIAERQTYAARSR